MTDNSKLTTDYCSPYGELTTALTVCYAVTPDAKYRRMAAASIYTLVRHNPDVRVYVAEVEAADYPYGIKPAALRDVSTPWVLFLDADTIVRGPLAPLMAYNVDFCARVGTAWTHGWLDRAKWEAICEHFALSPTPVLNAGAFLCRCHVAEVLADCWTHWMEAIRRCALEDPQRQPNRPLWWMLDQYALALALAENEWRVCYWGRREHSYGWKGEQPGLIHHYGTKRWQDPLEYSDK